MLTARYSQISRDVTDVRNAVHREVLQYDVQTPK